MANRIKIRDPVHDFIEFEGREIDILNCRLLQRLRRIHQLALTSLVYPGALHTRFDHTLGVTHVAGEMAKALGLDKEEDKSLIRLAALLHDIGHGPFSHVSEGALEYFADRGTLDEVQKQEKIHELITGWLIRNDPDLNHILGGQDCEKTAELLFQGYGEPVLRSIVSGPLDADKQDYLLRDSYFCGVKYGIFDIQQLQRSLKCEGKKDERELMIKEDGVHAVEQFVLAKYYLTTMVYRHKVRLICDQLILRAIFLGIEKDEIQELNNLYRFENSDKFYNNYLNWDDVRFIQEFCNKGEPEHKSKQLLDLINQRKLLKLVFKASINDFPAESKEKLFKIEDKANSVLRSEIEIEIASVLSKEFRTEIEADFTIFHAYEIKSVLDIAKNDEASVPVLRINKDPSTFQEISTLFASINEKLSESFVEVYAPVNWTTSFDKKRKLNNVKDLIKEIINQKLSTP